MACQPRRLLAVAVALTLVATLLASPNAADSLSFGSSNGSVFELGFFTRAGGEGGSGTYLGIWYRGIPGPTIVWVANRHNPVVSSPGELRLSAGGQLQVVDGNTYGAVVIFGGQCDRQRRRTATRHRQ
jgi:hypothetical protein